MVDVSGYENQSNYVNIKISQNKAIDSAKQKFVLIKFNGTLFREIHFQDIIFTYNFLYELRDINIFEFLLSRITFCEL